MNTEIINYSQCWEDPHILLDALKITLEDRVLSITSGGDNTLALLIAHPHRIVSIDMNVAQNYLLELKYAAARSLSYNEYVQLLGVVESSQRLDLYKKARSLISAPAQEWWSRHSKYIEIGLIHCGRFEKFTALFAHHVLPIIHNRNTIKRLLSFDIIEEQRAFFYNTWNSRRWRLFLKFFTSRFILKRFARQRGMFSHSNIQNVARIYEKRMEDHLNSLPNKGNYFIHYSLMGNYGDTLPPYLQLEGFNILRSGNNSLLSVETNNMVSYLRSIPDGSFSKFNLSDIFEALSEQESDALWHEIVRTAQPGARVAYWNNLVKRSYPHSLSEHIRTDDKLTKDLQSKDKVFFYDSFHVHTIEK